MGSLKDLQKENPLRGKPVNSEDDVPKWGHFGGYLAPLTLWRMIERGGELKCLL